MKIGGILHVPTNTNGPASELLARIKKLERQVEVLHTGVSSLYDVSIILLNSIKKLEDPAAQVGSYWTFGEPATCPINTNVTRGWDMIG